jgi:coenzyme F420-0:L-glutamate ligase/coenzyme F420-1:gamma-L-glutamate ligase
VADEIAGAAELAQGKLGGRPFAVLRGRADLVLPPGEDGPGARALVRGDGGDMFGYGAREAVVRALCGDPADRTPFGAPAPAGDLAAALREVLGARGDVTGDGPGPGDGHGHGLLVTAEPGATDAVAALAFAHGWAAPTPAGGDPRVRLRLRPATP